MIRSALVISVFLFPLASNAQNLMQNPSFDSGLSDWTTSSNVTWDTSQDHGADGVLDGGSMRISTTSSDSANQCVAVSPAQRYVLSAWIEENPLREFNPCSLPLWNLRLEWFDDSICQDNKLFTSVQGNQSPIPLGWNEASTTNTAPQNAHSVLITTLAGCGRQDGTSTFYFDDLTFTPDLVFKNDFEVHAGETGPQQPGM